LTHAAPEVRGGLERSAFTDNPISSSLRQELTPRTSTKRTPLKLTPTARLRHDDSQVQFAAIESSPIGETFLDSQLLTHRQREVKERQEAETAAMFPDLRSSPRPKSRDAKKDIPRISFVSDPASIGNSVADGPTTPTLPPPQHGPMDVFVGSSPTPRPRTREQLVGSDDIEPPSSPPDFRSVAADGLLAKQPSSPLFSSAQSGVNVCDVGEGPRPSAMEEPDNRNVKLDVHDIERTSELDQAGKLSSSADSLRETGTVTPLIGETTSGMINGAHPSDIDTFVDAPSNLIHSSAVRAADALVNDLDDISISDARTMKEQGLLDYAAEESSANSQPTAIGPMKAPTQSFSSLEDNISRVLNSFEDDGAEKSPSNEGQVSSQLKKDLSKAVGKDNSLDRGDANPDTTATLVPDTIKKRKRKTADGTLPPKKAKLSSHQSNIQVVVEVLRRARSDAGDGDMLDCIVVDSRPATARPHLPLSGVKLEQTPSPSRSAHGHGANTLKKKQLGRPRKGVAEGDTPASDEMTSPQSKKRRASEISAQHIDRASTSVTCPSVHKKRRSSRLSQTSSPSLSQRSNNSNIVQGDTDAGAVSATKSKRSAPTSHDEDTGSQRVSQETGNDAPPGRGDGDHTNESRVLCNKSEPPALAGKHTQVVSHDGAENDQSTVDKDESDFRAEAHTASTRAQGNGGLALDLHLGTDDVGNSIAERSGDHDADTTRLSSDIPEFQDGLDQTRLTPGRPQAGSSNGRGILGGLRRILKDIQRAVLGAQEEREIDDVLFDIRKEVHEAGRRAVS